MSSLYFTKESEETKLKRSFSVSKLALNLTEHSKEQNIGPQNAVIAMRTAYFFDTIVSTESHPAVLFKVVCGLHAEDKSCLMLLYFFKIIWKVSYIWTDLDANLDAVYLCQKHLFVNFLWIFFRLVSLTDMDRILAGCNNHWQISFLHSSVY